jgi:ADP-ribose pyrophosphatase
MREEIEMAIEPEQKLSDETVYSGKLFSVVREVVRLANGSERPREIVRHPGAVALVAIDGQGKLLLVRQYRRAADRVLLEIPAGTREPNEDAETCARRELIEETGYEAAEVSSLGGFFSAPGFCTEYLHCYLMTGLTEKVGTADEDENIELDRLSRSEVIDAIRRGEIQDAKTISGVMLWVARDTQV